MLTRWKPAVFQGNLRKSGYFEGWYFKNVSRDEKAACAVIPGVSIPEDREKAHAFVQFYDAMGGTSSYFRYPLSDFHAGRRTFELRIGENFFSLDRVHLDIDHGGEAIRADLAYRSIHPWPVTWLSPGAMGWYAFVPGMECYHGVLSFHHGIEGFFDAGGRRTDFTGGRGYVEKNWGTSMPSSWIWMQSNHFDDPEASLFGSIANIPWFGRYFTGYLFGLYHRGRVYRFTTYTGARVENLRVDENLVTLEVGDVRLGLEISGNRAEGVRLMAAKEGGMSTRINETLKSSIGLRFFRKRGGETICSGTGRVAGLECVGDVQELIEGLAPPAVR